MAERLSYLETDRDLGKNGAVDSRCLESCKKTQGRVGGLISVCLGDLI